MRARDSVITARREALERTLAGRFWLRGHLALMLVAALASGLIADYALLRVPVHAASLRWVLSVLVGYAIFFVALRVWLAYVGVRPLGKLDVDGFDDFGLGGGVGGGRAPVSAGARTSEVLPFGGGGRSGGAGASASFGESPGAFAPPRVGAGSVATDHGESSFSLGDIGDAAGSADHLGVVIVLVLVVLALVATLVGAVVYLLVMAPHLLVDVAFGSIVAGGLAPAAQRAAAPAWQGAVWHATWKPLTGMCVMVLVAGLVFSHYFPGARTLGEAWLLVHT